MLLRPREFYGITTPQDGDCCWTGKVVLGSQPTASFPDVRCLRMHLGTATWQGREAGPQERRVKLRRIVDRCTSPHRVRAVPLTLHGAPEAAKCAKARQVLAPGQGLAPECKGRRTLRELHSTLLRSTRPFKTFFISSVLCTALSRRACIGGAPAAACGLSAVHAVTSTM